MKSRISSCKKTAFRKNLSRFAPVWLGWLLFLGLILLSMTDADMNFWFPSNLANSIQVMGVFTCGYALLTAQVLFGDLYTGRMCNALHAMPLKREHWFGVHVRAGLWFCLVPSMVVAAVASVLIYLDSTMINGWQVPLYWWAATNLMYLFFFALAAFSALSVGNRFAMAVIYGILNCASVLVMFLVDSLYTPLLHGLVTPTDVFTPFCPVWETARGTYIHCTREKTSNTYIDAAGVVQEEQIGSFAVGDGWMYLLVIAAVGLVLLLIARQMYKKRPMECAGDFAATPRLAPFLQVVLTLMITSFFGVVYAMFFGEEELMLVYIAAGLVIGWFASRMFLKRTTRVFGLKSWLGLAALSAVMAVSLFVTDLDPMGLEDWVPQVSQVRTATVRLANYGDSLTTDSPEEIAEILRIHNLALEDKITEEEFRKTQYETGEDNPMVWVELSYENTGGRMSRRRYYVPVKSEEGGIVNGFLSDIRVISRHNTHLRKSADEEQFLALAAEPGHINLHHYSLGEEYLTEEFVEELLTAIAADCRAGTMNQNPKFHQEYIKNTEAESFQSICLDMYLKNDAWISVGVFPECENTMAVLEKTGIPRQIREE